MRAGRLALVALLLGSAPAFADDKADKRGGGGGGVGDGTFGLGLVLGDPTGLSGALGLSENTMLDAAVGFNLLRKDRGLYIHVEFLYFLPTLIRGSSVDLSAYLGIGGFLTGHKDVGIGARAPFGLSLDFSAAPIQIFGEAAIFVPLIPDPDLHVGGALGFRYWF